MASIFFSYSHADEGLRDQLEKHLSALRHQGVIEAWHDRRIPVGREFDREISHHLESDDIILLLVSSDFLASPYCYDNEMKRAMKRHSNGTAVVIPVILRPCDWHDTPFGKLLAAPKDGRPITQWPNVDEAFLDVVQAIKRTIAAKSSTTDIVQQTKEPAFTSLTSAFRSSNLRIAKTFTQRDRDLFLQEGFEYIAKFFQNSLSELVKRNPGIDQSFRRIDAERFAAAIYRDGEKVCQCTVYLGGMSRGIAYAMSDDVRSGSYNESVSVDADDQKLYFQPLGMQTFGRWNEKLSLEGAAEFFWSIFIRPIQ